VLPLQSTRQVLSATLHDVHGLGHVALAAVTQNPWSQTRPSLQSPSLPHA
jgi:hypothetical protein